MSDVKLRLVNLEKHYGNWSLYLNLEVRRGELFALVGPSGCGKTSVLKLIAGFIKPDAGEIFLDDRPLNDLPPRRRHVGIVFRDHPLFPHLDIYHNVAFGMETKRYSESSIKERVEELLSMARLEGAAERYPHELSGEERQRVVFLRALASDPEILLLDEPLGSLESALRKSIGHEIREIQKQLKLTTIYATRDQEEALAISDRLAVMKAGRIEQVGSPLELYLKPEVSFVAKFIGKSNVLTGVVREIYRQYYLVRYKEEEIYLPYTGKFSLGDQITFSFRPEDAYLSKNPWEKNSLFGKVVEFQFPGSSLLVIVEDKYGKRYAVSHYLKGINLDELLGNEIYLNFPPDNCRILKG